MRRACLLAAFAAMVISGCGGGGDNPSGSVDQANHTGSVGMATVAYEGKIVPAGITSFSGVTVATMAGASFSNVTLAPSHTLANSTIAFSMNGQIWTYENGVSTELTHSLSSGFNPTISSTGQVAFVALDPVSNFDQIYVCNLDGSGLHQLTTAAKSHQQPSWSPSGSKIVYYDLTNGNLDTVNANGSGDTPLSINGPFGSAPSDPSWSPDGSRIVFLAGEPAGEASQVYTVSASGGAATELSVGAGGLFENPRWSPDGTQIIAEFDAAGANSRILGLRSTLPQQINVLAEPPSGVDYSKPSFAPDGTSFLFLRFGTSNDDLVTVPMGAPGEQTTVVSSATTGATPTYPTWSSYFATKKFVGTGGQMSSASGFILSQVGDTFGSFVSLAATTPTKLTITQQPAGGTGGPAVYVAKADAITKLVYSNSYFGQLTSITTGNAPSVLISVSTLSGQIGLVAPLAKPGLRRATRGGSGFDGNFTAIYDTHGKNLAPSGATHLELDPKSGGLKSWR